MIEAAMIWNEPNNMSHWDRELDPDCFTPESHGLKPHHTSPPRDAAEFAEFCSAMVRRYAA